jgi:hypothetical protein
LVEASARVSTAFNPLEASMSKLGGGVVDMAEKSCEKVVVKNDTANSCADSQDTE